MSDSNGIVLIADDEEEVREFLGMAVRCGGYAFEFAADGEETLEALAKHNGQISTVLLDLLMPRKDGLATLRDIRKISPSLPVYVISAATSPSEVAQAMKAGATDFLAKPIDPDDVRRLLPPMPKPNGTAAMPLEQRVAHQMFFGKNPRMREIQSMLRLIGASEAPVLILGETGSGKEVLARELHALSPRSGRLFLKLNCAALPSELVESELFGYERGAFTGAFERKSGMFELADGGTILLDEIGDMDYRLQAKLLQVLQDRTFRRLGGKDLIEVDVRVMAATHQNLEAAAYEGRFRLDLYYRLNVINIELPPLRERTEDIIGLASILTRRHLPPNAPPVVFPPELKQTMLAYFWPGNIRELENVVRRFIMLRDGYVLSSELREKMGRQRKPLVLTAVTSPGLTVPSCSPGSLEQVAKAKAEAETEAILRALNATHWNRKRAAAILNIDYKALLYKMKKLDIACKNATRD